MALQHLFSTKWFLFFAGGLYLTACQNDPGTGTEKVATAGFGKAPHSLPTYEREGVTHFVVVNTAGSGKQMKYDPEKGKVVPTPGKGPLRFLPWPANFGFIPTSKTQIPAILVAAAQEANEVVLSRPIALAQVTNNKGVLTPYVICVPIEAVQQTIRPYDYTEFSIDYGPVKNILEDFLFHHQGIGKVESVQWKDEDAAHLLLYESR